MSDQVFTQIRGVMSEAMEERRGLVIYSRLEPAEMDRLARRVERSALEKVRGLLPEETTDQRVLGLRNRLRRMQDELDELGEQGQIQETSRRMQNDEIVWQAFEDIASMVGVQ
jgi:hypothetical protein